MPTSARATYAPPETKTDLTGPLDVHPVTFARRGGIGDFPGRRHRVIRRQTDSAVSLPRSSQSDRSASWPPPAVRLILGAEVPARNPKTPNLPETALPAPSTSEPSSRRAQSALQPQPLDNAIVSEAVESLKAPSIQALLQSALSHQGHVSLLRDKLLQVRAELNGERGRLNGIRRICRESLEAIDQSLRARELSADPTTTGSLFAELHLAWRENEIIKEAQEDKVKEVESKSSRLEFKIISKEKLAHLAIRSLFLSLGYDTSDILQPQSLISGSERALSDTPSLLQRFFVRKGDVSIYLERLQELEATHHEILERRAFLAERGDQEDSLPADDVDFLATYEEQHRFLTEELERAEEDSLELERKCQDAGYPIAFHAEPESERTESALSEDMPELPMSPERMRTELSSAPIAAPAQRVRRASERMTGKSEPITHLSAAAARVPKQRQDVQKWLSTVSDDPELPVPRSQESEEFASVRAEPQMRETGALPQRTRSSRRRSNSSGPLLRRTRSDGGRSISSYPLSEPIPNH